MNVESVRPAIDNSGPVFSIESIRSTGDGTTVSQLRRFMTATADLCGLYDFPKFSRLGCSATFDMQFPGLDSLPFERTAGRLSKQTRMRSMKSRCFDLVAESKQSGGNGRFEQGEHGVPILRGDATARIGK
jgi:hypothetical protein